MSHEAALGCPDGNPARRVAAKCSLKLLSRYSSHLSGLFVFLKKAKTQVRCVCHKVCSDSSPAVRTTQTCGQWQAEVP